MDSQETTPRVYRELADCYERRAEASMRDRFLILAMDAVLRDGRPDEAEKLRQRLLRLNPHHMLRPFGSFAEAAETADVQTYLRDLRINYPSEVAQVLLRSLRENAPAAPASEGNGVSVEPLKLYAVQENDSAQPQKPEPAPLRSERRHAKPARQPTAKRDGAKGDRKHARGAWFGVILFLVVVLFGAALLGYVVARPFFPLLRSAEKR